MARHSDFAMLERDFGVFLPGVQDYLKPEHKTDFRLGMDAIMLAMDAQQTSVTVGNSSVPAMFTTLIDPETVRVMLAPLEGADILGESKKGDWTKDTMAFPLVEMTGEVSSYGDFSNNGRAGLNNTWPQRQSYHHQVIIEYGEREVERAAEGKLNWISELQTSAANASNRYQDLTYHFGVAGLQNYGLLNDPALSAALTPATKAAGGARWITSGVITATANEVYTDVQTLYVKLVAQSLGNINQKTPLTLVTDPGSVVALTATNIYNVSVTDLLAKNFPNLEVKTSIRYATAGGNIVQLIADSIQGNDTGYCAFTEKARMHPLIKDLSSSKQKQTQGTWGAIIRYPVGIASMIGV